MSPGYCSTMPKSVQCAQTELCSHFLNARTEGEASPTSFIAHLMAWLFVHPAYPDNPRVSTSHDVTPARTFLRVMVLVLIKRQEKLHVIFKLLLHSRPSCPKPLSQLLCFSQSNVPGGCLPFLTTVSHFLYQTLYSQLLLTIWLHTLAR